MADGETLTGSREDDLGGDDEAREPRRVHLRTGDGGAARLLRPVEITNGVTRLGLANLGETLRELERRTARNIGFRFARVVDDLQCGRRRAARRAAAWHVAAVIEKFPDATTPTERSRAAESMSAKSVAVRPELPTTTPTPAPIAAIVFSLTAVAEV